MNVRITKKVMDQGTLEENKAMREKLVKYEIMLNCRAGKLLKKDKPFIVVAIDEPYFPQAYRLIRQEELKKGTWTDACETHFQRLIAEWNKL